MTRAPGGRLLLLGLVVLAGALVWLALRGSAAPRPDDPPAATAGTGTRPARRDSSSGPSARATAPALDSLRGTPVDVAVDTRPSGAPPVPASFLGLSFEVADLPRLARYAAGGGSDLVALLRSLGTGVLRLGGISADTQAAWAPDGRAPSWATTPLSAADIQGIGWLARESGWRVLLTVNLGHPDAAAAAQEVAAARRALGASLAGVELGNEPDRYQRKGLRGPSWDFSRYQAQVAEYRAAITAAAPGVALAGPDASSGTGPLEWVADEARLVRPALLTDHYYPSSSCGYTPVLSELLSPAIRAHESAMLARLGAIQRAAGIPLRVDETNNISCEGQPGVSDTFAAALWALDYATRAMRAGVAGLDFHNLIAKPRTYTLLAARSGAGLARGELHAQPQWYALLLAHSLLGGRPLGARVTTAGGAGRAPALTASALTGPGGRLQIVLDDFDPPAAGPALVRLRVPRRYAGGTILRLTAPSLQASAGVRLGGTAVAADGSWRPASPMPRVSGGPGSLALSVPAASAALITLSARS